MVASAMPLPGFPDPCIAIPVTGGVLLARKLKEIINKARDKVNGNENEQGATAASPNPLPPKKDDEEKIMFRKKLQD